MKTRILYCGLCLLMVAVAALRAPSQARPENPLDQLAWMVGGKWVANGERGPDGKPFHVEWSCHWSDNHRNLTFTTWFLIDGKLVPVYDGMYTWHPARKKMIFVYTDNEGNLTEGEAVMEGDRLHQEFHIVGAEGTERLFRSTILRRGPDDYDWNVEAQKNGTWTEMLALKYKRSRV